MSPQGICDNVKPPVALSYSTAIMSAILSVITTGGNFLICLAVYKDPYKLLRTPFMHFLVGLAISDLLAGCVTMPISAVMHVREAREDIHPIHMEIARPSQLISTTASVLNLVALCVDRYIAVTRPMKYRQWLTFKRCLIISLVIWVLSISLPMFLYLVNYVTYLMIYTNTGTLLIMFTMLVTYFRVSKTLRIHSSKLNKNIILHHSKKPAYNPDCSSSGMENISMNKANGVNTDCSTEGSSMSSKKSCFSQKTSNLSKRKNHHNQVEQHRRSQESGTKKESVTKRMERKVTRMYTTIIKLFLISYIPVIISVYILWFCPHCNCVFRHVLRDIQYVFALSNSAINPFVCTIRLKPFYQSLTAIVGFRSKDQPIDFSETNQKPSGSTAEDTT